MAQSICINQNQTQGIYIHELSKLGPCLRNMPLGLIFFLLWPNNIILVLDKLTSRV